MSVHLEMILCIFWAPDEGSCRWKTGSSPQTAVSRCQQTKEPLGPPGPSCKDRTPADPRRGPLLPRRGFRVWGPGYGYADEVLGFRVWGLEALRVCVVARRHPISTAFTSVWGGPPTLPPEGLPGSPPGAPADKTRDCYSECYCLASSLEALGCSANAWVWVQPEEGPPGGPRRLLRLLALPAQTEEEGPQGAPGAPCRCWRGALAVSVLSEGSDDECEDPSQASVHPKAGGGPPEAPPLFLPPHILQALQLSPGRSLLRIREARELMDGGATL